jgi:hypothetical protein
MSRDDEATPRARRLSSPMTLWGTVSAWKAMRAGRFAHLDVGDESITVTVGDGASEPITEVVRIDEDPSAAFMRAVARLGIG